MCRNLTSNYCNNCGQFPHRGLFLEIIKNERNTDIWQLVYHFELRNRSNELLHVDFTLKIYVIAINQ